MADGDVGIVIVGLLSEDICQVCELADNISVERGRAFSWHALRQRLASPPSNLSLYPACLNSSCSSNVRSHCIVPCWSQSYLSFFLKLGIKTSIILAKLRSPTNRGWSRTKAFSTWRAIHLTCGKLQEAHKLLQKGTICVILACYDWLLVRGTWRLIK
jgi:hypothetical protein